MRERLAVLLAYAVIAVVLAASASETEAKSGDASGLISQASTTLTQQKRQQHHDHRGSRASSLVSHWLDSALGSSSAQEESSFSFDRRSSSSVLHHRNRGNSSRPPLGGGSGKGRGERDTDDDAHKPLLPLRARDYLGLLASALAILLASGSGIGGGGLLVPIFLLVLGFGTRDSVALSNLTILGSSAVSLLFNLPRRHPRHADRPLIDWDIILVMEPST